MRYLVTGGAGFIGHHVVEHILRSGLGEVVVLDRLDTSGNLNRLSDLDNWNLYMRSVKFIFHDLKAPISPQLAQQIGPVDAILHLAAGTHVDRSITNPLEFVMDNVVGTAHMLEYAREHEVKQFVYFSTDEVFGPAPNGVAYKEWDRYNSGNPYSAAKAGAEELCLAYHNTYGIPVKITHCMNVFGERQHPEKYVPMVISKVRDNKKIFIHSDSTKTKPGSRFYIHARNVADAVVFVMKNGAVGDKFNIVGEREVDNLELAKLIAGIQGRELLYELVDFHSSRPGHDLRYALDGTKLAEMGWKPKVNFESSLIRVVNWSLDRSSKWLMENV